MNKEQKELLDKLIGRNEQNYNLTKLGEECQKLGLVITQFILKPEKVDFQKVIDEIGDVEIRVKMMRKALGPELRERLDERIAFKLSKYQEYLDENKYKNI
jgi:NTP pyrophosphatase (non-canonical NTP hydrolase)